MSGPRIKASYEDFVVDEIPAYEPCGEGDHLFVRFRKRGRATDEVVRELARALSVSARDIGVAGLKDKAGITTQTVSLPVPPRGASRPDLEARAAALTIDGVTVLETKWHKNKLKTGHLRGNRFDIVVRDIAEADIDAVLGRFEEIAKLGVPNLFGPQRFGFEGRNVERARAWISGNDRGPRDGKARRFSFSSWQSWIFNRVLEARIADGTWCTAVHGDLMQKHASGGLFPCEDAAVDRERCATMEISATGPMIGETMRWPEGAVAELEEAVVAEELALVGVTSPEGRADFFKRMAILGEGTRRLMRQPVAELSASREQPGAVRVRFVLPSGAYATTVLARAVPGLSERDEPASADADAGATNEGRTELSS